MSRPARSTRIAARHFASVAAQGAPFRVAPATAPLSPPGTDTRWAPPRKLRGPPEPLAAGSPGVQARGPRRQAAPEPAARRGSRVQFGRWQDCVYSAAAEG
ncbi:unnamed protein product [Prorocentrum cordatum]|uniref:Uncharacterized protein n=1 Tax=Prorocentrum cordatum TaxID=2364126 RepID=A0ABN9TP42_9DINO|nr:unnamed protein product [Polarella glacialis]